MTKVRQAEDGTILGRVPSRGKRGGQQAAFLKALRYSGVIAVAARAAGINRQTHYIWMADEAYRRAYEEAMADAVERIEEEALRRAVEGWEEPVVSQGKLVYGEDGKPLTKRVFSDRLMEVVLKGRMSEVYGPKAQQAALQGRPPAVVFELRLTESDDHGAKVPRLPIHEREEPLEGEFEELA